MQAYQRDFIRFAIERGVLRFGEFTLKSGRTSPYFFNAGLFDSGLALARCVDPDHNSVSWEAFGVAIGCITPFTSVFVAIWPVLAMQSQWILVGIGGAVTLACVLFGELILRKSK